MIWKKLAVYCAASFAISGLSSWITWRVMIRHKTEPVSWQKVLSLNPEQSQKFTAMESALGDALKDLTLEDSQNKISICTFVQSRTWNDPEMNVALKKMGETYRAKQEKIVRSLAAITGILNPSQKEIFAQRLMHEVCVSCRTKTSSRKCICGMCGGHS